MKMMIRAMVAGMALAFGAGAAAALASGSATETPVVSSLLADVVKAMSDVPAYGWFGLLAVSIVGSSAYLGATLNQLRRDQRLAFETADRREFELLAKTRERDASEQLNSEDGWRSMLAQVVADVTATGVVIDEAGVLNATIHPTPYFTVRAADGREFYFTVDAKKLRSTKVVPEKSQAISVTQGSLTAAVDLHLIWNRLTQQRRMAEVTLPRHARWYCIVKHPELAGSNVNGSKSAAAAFGRR
jgi:hypothetical protein